MMMFHPVAKVLNLIVLLAKKRLLGAGSAGN
jgi:hypothetical protein